MSKFEEFLLEAQFLDLSVVQNPTKQLSTRELARAVRMAIAAEHEAVHLYELISDRTKNNKAKDILQDIANEEKVHVGELEALLASIDPDDVEKREEGEEEADIKKESFNQTIESFLK